MTCFCISVIFFNDGSQNASKKAERRFSAISRHVKLAAVFLFLIEPNRAVSESGFTIVLMENRLVICEVLEFFHLNLLFFKGVGKKNASGER
jgi:hypothetical protein